MIEKMAMFKITFVSVVLEALPFILLGSLISSLIHVFVSEETIQKYIPKNSGLAIVGASLMGVMFPVCECAIVPIVRRLVKKGVPIYVAIPFMVSVPVINPIVLFSTFMAFGDNGQMALIRGLGGLVVAWTLGLILLKTYDSKEDLLLADAPETATCGCGCGHEHGHHHHDHHGHTHVHGIELQPNTEGSSALFEIVTPAPVQAVKRKVDWIEILNHTSMEFYDVGRMLILGAFLSALFKTFVSRTVISGLSANPVSSTILMLGLAFVLSLCSEADAFIARTFADSFTTGSIAAFLILGPMIDVKNYLMLSGTFKQKFVLRLTALIFGLAFIVGMVINFGIGGGLI